MTTMRAARAGLAALGAALLACVMSAGPAAAADPSWTITRYAGNGAGGAPTVGAATSPPLRQPVALAFDRPANLYIADSTNNLIEKVTPAGRLSVFAGSGTGGAPTPGAAVSSAVAHPT